MSTFGPNDQRPSSRAAPVRASANGAAVLPPPPGSSPAEHSRRPRAVPDLPPESTDDREWDARVAREVQHQELIEASFDRAEAYGRLGDFEHALQGLAGPAAAGAPLPMAYRARRARWAQGAALRPRPAG